MIMDAAAETAVGSAPATDRSPGRALVLTLVAWSLVVWGTRIDNIVSDESLDGAGQAWRVALALSFVVPAVVVGARWWPRSGPRSRPWPAEALAWWTIVVWIVRGAGIALGDHDAAFIAVHLVLAVVSIGIAGGVLRSLSGRPTPSS
jgi:hypothetical protein